MKSYRSFVWSLLIATGLVLACGQAFAEDDETKKSAQADGASADMGQGGIVRQRVSLERDSESILRVFEPTISDVSASTVEVMVGERRVALATVVSADGELLTKASQLNGVPRFKQGERVWESFEVLGVDSEEDLALVKIPAEGLVPIEFTGYEEPAIGSWVVSSAPDKQVLSIGIVGVRARSIPREPAALGIRMDRDAVGVVVSDFSDKNSPAGKAGVMIGDRIVEVDDEPINQIGELKALTLSHSPGEIVVLTIERADETLSIEVELGNLALISDAFRQREMQDSLGSKLSKFRSGFSTALQHDSPLDAADCGGPIVDLEGQPVGINIARAGRVNSYALPLDLIASRLELLRGGELRPEVVFADRIGRLQSAADELSTSIKDLTTVRLVEVQGELAAIQVKVDTVSEEGMEEDQPESAETTERMKSLVETQAELEHEIEALEVRRDKYLKTISSLQRGLQVR